MKFLSKINKTKLQLQIAITKQQILTTILLTNVNSYYYTLSFISFISVKFNIAYSSVLHTEDMGESDRGELCVISDGIAGFLTVVTVESRLSAINGLAEGRISWNLSLIHI